MSGQKFTQEEVDQIWSLACEDLKGKISAAAFDTWILNNPLTEIELNDDKTATGVIESQSSFHANSLKKILLTQLKDSLEKALNVPIDIEFKIKNQSKKSDSESSNKSNQQKKSTSNTQTQPKDKDNQSQDQDLNSQTNQLSDKNKDEDGVENKDKNSVLKREKDEASTTALSDREKRLKKLEPKLNYKKPLDKFKSKQKKFTQNNFQSKSTKQTRKSSSAGPSPTVNGLFSENTIKASLRDRALTTAQRVGLKLDYTFQSFAVSSTNEMAHAAAIAVSKKPGQAYNPLFLYGGVGVGKTHLMHAIGHNILIKNPSTNIIYCTGEEFTNAIISAIQTKKAFSFKNKYRNAQVLLIDDIQFIAGKNAVQEEFFHTFNALTKQAAQIVLTSDRPPHEIDLLESRLRSRFEAGLMIDIQQPSHELRTAIVLIKSRANNLPIPMELAQVIAKKVNSARRIEGIITSIRSEVELKNKEINQNLIEDLLGKEQINQKKIIRLKPQEIIRKVSKHFGIKQAVMKGKKRTKEVVTARHIAMYLLKSELNMSYNEIGKWFSNRDHTTVMHAYNKIEDKSQEDDYLSQQLTQLKYNLFKK